jgi:hypothetical protein
LPRYSRLKNFEIIVKVKTIQTLLVLLSLSSFSTSAQVNLKTVIKDLGAKEKDKVNAKEVCAEVVKEELESLKISEPDFKGKVSIKEAAPLEVYRADSSFGYAAKCILQIKL